MRTRHFRVSALRARASRLAAISVTVLTALAIPLPAAARRTATKTGLDAHARRLRSVAVLGILALALTACTGRGGGQLPPDAVGGFNGSATFGFDFSCERSSRSTSLNPPAGQLRIELAYTDHGTSLLGSSFSIHGIVDVIDPVVESMYCNGQNPPDPVPNELIFVGRYRFTSSAPQGVPAACSGRETETTPLCRFEVFVRDNDVDGGPSRGDFFQIKLSSGTALDDNVDPSLVFYTRGGLLSNGNLTVD